MAAKPQVIHRPPLPPLTRETFWREGADVFRSWATLQQMSAADVPHEGHVRVSVHPTEPDIPPIPFSEPRSQPLPEPMPFQLKTYVYLKEHGSAVREAVLNGIFRAYAAIREEYEQSIGHDPMPTVISISDLAPVIGLVAVNILNGQRDGYAYVGLEFRRAWDAEHGLGVVTHLERVVDVGQAEIASHVPLEHVELDPSRPVLPPDAVIVGRFLIRDVLSDPLPAWRLLARPGDEVWNYQVPPNIEGSCLARNGVPLHAIQYPPRQGIA